MHSKLTFAALASSIFLLASTGVAQLIIHTPAPTPLPSTPPTLPSPSPAAQPISATDEILPVVIAYGEGAETRVQITRGIMEPVGVPPNQPVTVTLYLASGIPGSPVEVGLYDGGQISPAVTPAVTLRNPAPISTPPTGGGVTVDPTVTAPILVLADGSVRFNFQSGLTLGLYRTLVTIGPKQYLLQFYAVRPRSNADLPPLPPTPAPYETPPHQ